MLVACISCSIIAYCDISCSSIVIGTDDEVFEEDVETLMLTNPHGLRSNEASLCFLVKYSIHRGRESTKAVPEVELLLGDREISFARGHSRRSSK